MDWKNHLQKNPIQKNEKTVKIKVKLPHVNKKPLARKRIFVQTPFSHSTLNLERKNFTPKNHSLFSLHFLFRRDQNHYSNLTSKIMKMCEQILKKRQRPNTIQILWIVKNQEHRNIATLSLQLRSYKNEHLNRFTFKDERRLLNCLKHQSGLIIWIIALENSAYFLFIFSYEKSSKTMI